MVGFMSCEFYLTYKNATEEILFWQSYSFRSLIHVKLVKDEKENIKIKDKN